MKNALPITHDMKLRMGRLHHFYSPQVLKLLHLNTTVKNATASFMSLPKVFKHVSEVVQEV